MGMTGNYRHIGESTLAAMIADPALVAHVRTYDETGEVFRRWERCLFWRTDRFEMVSHEADLSGPEIHVDVRIPLPDGDSVTPVWRVRALRPRRTR